MEQRLDCGFRRNDGQRPAYFPITNWTGTSLGSLTRTGRESTSPSWRSALPLAQSLARDSGAALLILYVHERPVELLAEGGVPVSSLDIDTEALKQELQQALPADPRIACEYHVLLGSPAPEIVRFAKESGVDLIVMSTHGRRGLSHFLMGSVAEAVVLDADKAGGGRPGDRWLIDESGRVLTERAHGTPPTSPHAGPAASDRHVSRRVSRRVGRRVVPRVPVCPPGRRSR